MFFTLQVFVGPATAYFHVRHLVTAIRVANYYVLILVAACGVARVLLLVARVVVVVVVVVVVFGFKTFAAMLRVFYHIFLWRGGGVARER